MSKADARAVYPLSPEGAVAGLGVVSAGLILTDLTPRPRFGLKGRGAADWLTSRGAALPAINRRVLWSGMDLLRLGGEDFVLLAETAPEALASARETWAAGAAPRGYRSWREESWAWFRLTGVAVSEAMSTLCALDLRRGAFPDDGIAQTRLGGIDAVVFRCEEGFDMLFDITTTASMIARIAQAAGRQRPDPLLQSTSPHE